jgi:hypothetical protein
MQCGEAAFPSPRLCGMARIEGLKDSRAYFLIQGKQALLIILHSSSAVIGKNVLYARCRTDMPIMT